MKLSMKPKPIIGTAAERKSDLSWSRVGAWNDCVAFTSKSDGDTADSDFAVECILLYTLLLGLLLVRTFPLLLVLCCKKRRLNMVMSGDTDFRLRLPMLLLPQPLAKYETDRFKVVIVVILDSIMRCYSEFYERNAGTDNNIEIRSE